MNRVFGNPSGLPIRLLLPFLLVVAGLESTFAATAPAPYIADRDTLHLWQFDEPLSATNCADSVAGGVALTAVRNGATLGNVSLADFGEAASTYDAGPAATLAANPNGIPGRDAYLGPLPLVDGTGDNTALSFTGTNGAFTIEALLRVDFNPTNQAVAPDTGRSMQIISADAEETVRLFQFRMVWSSVNDLTPEIIFINIGNPIQSLAAVLPTTGSNALSTSNWYHLAATYNGQPNTAGNFKFFWTKVETNRTRADLLASLRMTNNLPVGSGDWTIGNDGRATGGSDQNWVGLIDEVRLSGVARQANEFIFRGVSVLAASSVDGTNAPEHTLDGNPGTRWSALGDGEWIAYDLGRVELISAVNIAFYLGNTRTSKFDVQTSPDALTWTNALIGAVSSGTTLALETFDLPDTPARYVRIVGHGNSQSLWNSYTEVEIRSAPARRLRAGRLAGRLGVSILRQSQPDRHRRSRCRRLRQSGGIPGRIEPHQQTFSSRRHRWGRVAGRLGNAVFRLARSNWLGRSGRRRVPQRRWNRLREPIPPNPTPLPATGTGPLAGRVGDGQLWFARTNWGADDPDGDWFSNRHEFLAGTNPNDPAVASGRAQVCGGCRWTMAIPPPANTRIPAASIPPPSSAPPSAPWATSSSSPTTAATRPMPAYAFNNKLWVARRTVGSNVWEMFRTGFTANNITDGHDCISLRHRWRSATCTSVGACTGTPTTTPKPRARDRHQRDRLRPGWHDDRQGKHGHLSAVHETARRRSALLSSARAARATATFS